MSFDYGKLIAKPKTKFLRVKCQGCGNKQVIFSSPKSVVRCLVCNVVLAEPTANKGKLKTKVLEVLE